MLGSKRLSRKTRILLTVATILVLTLVIIGWVTVRETFARLRVARHCATNQSTDPHICLIYDARKLLPQKRTRIGQFQDTTLAILGDTRMCDELLISYADISPSQSSLTSSYAFPGYQQPSHSIHNFPEKSLVTHVEIAFPTGNLPYADIVEVLGWPNLESFRCNALFFPGENLSREHFPGLRERLLNVMNSKASNDSLAEAHREVRRYIELNSPPARTEF
ncbi:hypothetical protein Plim_4176 [Planctopirus limnophila DSM 3776]|uniref:Uncharacterized protein n=1 Tax=Planctopirus limnophila (strain ATCC 43296 / DSM 3776 / IFAM 1008 / Mu 290) TaxID=521674 RepID=D5SZ84_PLAL2|nr:hypothetical protein Plim_4176 [Planctopirus limnophila DSM 3776]